MMTRFYRKYTGFTLLELMIALSIFAVVSLMATGGMSRVLSMRQGTEVQADKLKRMQKVYHLLERDFSQAIDRKVRSAYGSDLDALMGNSQYDGVEFSHLGHANPVGFLRSEIQRVRYRLEDGELIRSSWRVLDRVADSEPDDVTLLEEAEAFSVRYLTRAQAWTDRWPPSSTAGAVSAAALPLAVDVKLTTAELGALNWTFRMPEAYQPGRGVPPAGGGGGAIPPGGHGSGGGGTGSGSGSGGGGTGSGSGNQPGGQGIQSEH
ncbi:MAG: type II secretion system minor pseudopilin GspJ [Gammaproteobacteria bacterium]